MIPWKLLIQRVVKAALVTLAIGRITEVHTTSVMLVICFCLVTYLYSMVDVTKRDALLLIERKSVVGVSGILATFYVVGDWEGIVGGLDNSFFQVSIVGATWVGLILLLQLFLIIIGRVTAQWNVISKEALPITWKEQACVGVVCMFGWLPYLLMYYPGVLTIDSIHQLSQVQGIYAPSNHHPFVHTMLIGVFYRIGVLLTQDVTTAVAFYTVAQMVFLTSVVIYFYTTLRKGGVNRVVCYGTILFYAGMPYNGYYAITMWKDVVFAGTVLVFTSTMLRMLWEDFGAFSEKRNYVMYLASGMGMCLLRSNGWYAFLFVAPFVILTFRKRRKYMVLIQGVIIALVIIIKGPVMDSVGIIQPDLVESLSVPLQQIARVLVLDLEVTKEQAAFLEEILDGDQLEEVYNPYVSDGMKGLIRKGNQAYLEENFTTFIQLYIQMGLKHPSAYLQAFRDQSIGYWFPIQEGIIGGDEGVIANELGIENRPVLKGPMVVKWNEITLKLKDVIPLYGAMWCMGAILWAVIIAASLVLGKGQIKYTLLYIPCIAIVATLMIATPVAKEFRYAYAYVYCLPLYMIVPFCIPRKNESCHALSSN